MSNGMHAPAGAHIGPRDRRALVAIVGALLVASTITLVIERARTVGAAAYRGSAAGSSLAQPIVDIAATPTGHGYWLVSSSGRVYPFGDAHAYGSTANIRLSRPIVGMSSTPTGRGYWLVASDGGIFSFGDAHFHGSTGGFHLVQPIVGIASTPSGRGYWMVASDGGIFAFGDAHFYGSTGGIRLAKPTVGMSSTPSGHGYWLVASDGGIFAFGDAHFYGSTGGIRLAQPIVGVASTLDGRGYWMVASDGGIFAFGSAHFYGSASGKLGGQRAVGLVASPDAQGYWIASQWGGVDSASSAGIHVDPKLQPHGNEQAIATELVNRINAERAARGLRRLSVDPLLQSYASMWAHHLAGANTFEHQDLMVILRAANGRLEQAGENLFAAQGAGADDAGTAHNALMHSNPHRFNILVPEEQLIGVGAACIGDKLVVVEDFATPMGIPLGSYPTPALQPIAAGDLAGASC